jgi:hypothetical protein
MSQLIVYQGAFGIALATDSRAVRFTASGDPSYFSVSKLYPLNPTTVLATVGSGYGHLLCQAFQQRLQRLQHVHGDDIPELAFPFLRDGRQAQPATAASQDGDSELQLVYFVIAGTITGRKDCPLGFVVYASEQATEPLHPLTTGHFVCIPRQLSMETRLQQLSVDEVSWEQVEGMCRHLLLRMAAASEDVGPPFLLTRITTEGILTRVVEDAVLAGIPLSRNGEESITP